MDLTSFDVKEKITMKQNSFNDGIESNDGIKTVSLKEHKQKTKSNTTFDTSLLTKKLFNLRCSKIVQFAMFKNCSIQNENQQKKSSKPFKS